MKTTQELSEKTQQAIRETVNRREAAERPAHDWLAPDERSCRNVWRTFRWFELGTGLGAAAWVFLMWLIWIYK